ncbi:sodium:proton antiporter [Flavobacterium supellecticarium]|uniref:Sodium:proton antiporter n=1 Tax=Flavobacterium supellecticarium TaxID=2565924 RepID=A0A4S4A013_9FLAO|nr:cation:proton antiporter [Flavobacterium supellecticarium]THF51623.1 sodium:proton antiporter [Flavobacterium supellecticarium]
MPLSTAETVAETSHHLYPLISDLGLILMTAGVAVLLFKKIKQPLVLGYLVAGFLAGNNFDFFPSVTDSKSVEVWAEIGVIFLLFSLGLEFSFKKLMKVGGTASITAIIQIISMLFIGYMSGQWMGWSQMDSIFLGAILSMSSTTIILRAFDELNVKGKKYAGIVFGALIVEDIVAILLMVLLSTISVSQQFSGAELFESVLKLLFFLILWFVGGIFFIPTLLKKAKTLLNEETLLIISLALCLMMVILATNAGFSPALGAFIMGSIIAETTQAEKIEHLIKPVKDLFGAVFFVSVGMLINPDTLVEYAIPVLLITLITILGKTVSTAAGALVSGQPLKQSVQAGMSLAQIGEFSFIIATLGMSLKVTSDFLYPIVVAVSAVTTFTTPFMIKMSMPFYEKLEKVLPKKWLTAIDNYSTNSQSIKATSNWQVVLRATMTQVVISSVIIIAIILLADLYISPLVIDSKFGNAVAALITLVIIAPFLWALSLRRVAESAMEELRKERKYRGPLTMLILVRIGLALFFVGFLLNNFFSPIVAFIALILVIISYIIFPKKLHAQYDKIEKHFLKNFNDREIARAQKTRDDLTPWDGHMANFEIAKESNLAGKKLQDLKVREKMGVNIAFIKRGEIMINIPTRNERLFPGDEICVIGTDDQVQNFKGYLDQNEIEVPESVTEAQIVLQQYELTNQEFIGKSIRESQLRERTGGLVVGIERNGERILNPESHLILERNDILWLVGDKKLLAAAFKNQ